FFRLLKIMGLSRKDLRSRKMRPKRYPYSGQKESTFVKADPELVEKLLRNTSFLECLQKKPINFQIDLEEFKRLSYEAIHDTSQVTQ
ncbi:hypothetical protein, partial [Streptococcus pneumoniae]